MATKRVSPSKALKTIEQIDEITSDRKWADAILTVKKEGGFPVPSVNPFIQDTGSSDTVTYVTAALEYLSRMIPGDEGVRSDKECQFGHYLLMSTLVEALRAANVQADHEHKVARARGILAAPEGVK